MYYQRAYDGISDLIIADGYQATIATVDGCIRAQAQLEDQAEANRLIEEYIDHTGMRKLEEGSVFRKYREFHVLEGKRLNDGKDYSEGNNVQEVPKVYQDDVI